MIVNLFIKYFSEYGGAERICYNFSNFLLSKGIEVNVYCGENRSTKVPEGLKLVETGLARPGRYKKSLSFYKRASEIASKTEGVNFSFEKIENADIFRPGGGSHRVFMRKSLLGLTGSQLFKKKIKRFLDPVNRLNPKLEKKVLSNPRLKFIIAISKLVRNEMAEEFGLSKSKFQVIYNGVNEERFNIEVAKKLRPLSREKFGLEEDDIAIGFASSNFQLKGLHQLVQSMALLPSNHKLLVAGGRNPDFYLKTARQLGVADRIRFLGKVSDMQGFYAALNVFCHPTFFDTYANVINEANAMGVPAAVSRFAGSSEFVLEYKTGSVINEVEPKAISEAILAAEEKCCGNFHDKVFSEQDIFNKYLELCQKAEEMNKGMK